MGAKSRIKHRHLSHQFAPGVPLVLRVADVEAAGAETGEGMVCNGAKPREDMKHSLNEEAVVGNRNSMVAVVLGAAVVVVAAVGHPALGHL